MATNRLRDFQAESFILCTEHTMDKSYLNDSTLYLSEVSRFAIGRSLMELIGFQASDQSCHYRTDVFGRSRVLGRGCQLVTPPHRATGSTPMTTSQ